jgi:hypothetical protein
MNDPVSGFGDYHQNGGNGRKAYEVLPGRSREAVPLKLSTFGKREGIIDIHAQISYRALDLRMTEQDLDSA